MTESLPRCLLAWVVFCGVAWMFGVLLAVVDLWERADDARLLEEAVDTATDFVTVDDILEDYKASFKEQGSD